MPHDRCRPQPAADSIGPPARGSVMTHLYFLRHGDADHPGKPTWKTDAERPLNPEGRRRMTAEARGMKALGITIDAIVTSPYVRAAQTARCVASAYGLEERIVPSELLEPGGSFRDLEKALRGTRGDAVLVVGHAPDLGLWAGHLVGADEIPLGKGWLAWVRLRAGEMRKGSARLMGLLPAEILAAAGRR